jgi:GLPGLI family protein
MMKKFSTIIILVIYMPELVAQVVSMPKNIEKYQILDSAIFEVIYELNFIKDPVNNVKETDFIILEIGENISKSYSKTLYEADSVATAWIAMGRDAVPSTKKYVPPMDVYKNYQDQKRTITYRSFLHGAIFKYVEDINSFNWEVIPEISTIHGYTCQKAVMSYGGRNYEAWFTMEIPLLEGPWKFDGLPGLILKIRDTDNHYIYECISFNKLPVKKSIKMWEWDYENTKRKDLQSFVKRMHLNTYEYFKTIGQEVRYRDVPDDKQDEEARKRLIYPYNPIELE